MRREKLIHFILNDKDKVIQTPPNRVVLDYLRQEQRLTGTKEGCREGDCGACVVLLGNHGKQSVHYQTVCSCLLSVGELAGKHLVTIEGIEQIELNPIQKIMVDEYATQCGFCAPGFVLAFAGFLLTTNSFDEREAISAVSGNICRCTGYQSIKRVAARLCEQFRTAWGSLDKKTDRIQLLIDWGVFPDYFLQIPARLGQLQRGARVIKHRPTMAAVKMAGGTDLLVQRAEELRNAEVDWLMERRDLCQIAIGPQECDIGATVTITDLFRHSKLNDLFPDLRRALALISSAPIRNRATVGGNIMNASPIGDLTIWLLSLNAEVQLQEGSDRRRIPLKHFFTAYKTLAVKPSEIIERIIFPTPEVGRRHHFDKVSKRKHLDIASVNSAISILVKDDHIESVGLSAGGVAPIPLFMQKTCDFLQGAPLNEKTVMDALLIAVSEIFPISDVRGSALYKKVLLGQLIKAHFLALFPNHIHPEGLR